MHIYTILAFSRQKSPVLWILLHVKFPFLVELFKYVDPFQGSQILLGRTSARQRRVILQERRERRTTLNVFFIKGGDFEE